MAKNRSRMDTMHLDTSAMVCSVLPHAEHGLVLRAFSAGHGLLSAYVQGGRSSRLRGVLQPGNIVALSLSTRAAGQLASARVELEHPRAALATSRAALATLEWSTALAAATLPEGVPHPGLHKALDALVQACAADVPALMLGTTLVRYELMLLADLGFGLDLGSCAATGVRTDLAYVSPRSSQAVSRAAGAPWAARLLPLPAFLTGPVPATSRDLEDGLNLTAFFLARHLLAGRHAQLLEARPLLVSRLTTAQAMDEPQPSR